MLEVGAEDFLDHLTGRGHGTNPQRGKVYENRPGANIQRMPRATWPWIPSVYVSALR